MALAEEDLRIIDFDISKHAYTGVIPPETVRSQHRFIESQGGHFFRTIFQ